MTQEMELPRVRDVLEYVEADGKKTKGEEK
jgi:hypothetical protein